MAAVAVLAAGCVAPDQDTVSIDGADGADQTLPPVTEAAPVDDGSSGSEGTSTSPDDDDDGGADPSTTSTTEPLPPLEGLDADLLVSGFDQPILVTSAPGTDLLFVVEREGIIWVVDDGTILDEPFLDLTDRLLSNSIEQGLLGLAFHPEYETNQLFFAYWTDPEGDSRLSAFTTGSTPTAGDPDSERLVLAVDQPAERHNAGMVQFGPDGLLYLALGDGGDGGQHSQDISNLLGTVVRIDVSPTVEAATGGTGQAAEAYLVPDGNPFDDEIWVYGLRNPWRFSIDEPSGNVYIGDVGQDGFEEINVVGLDGAGTNFGWSEMEGDECFRSGCETAGMTTPVLQYSHADGCSVTGGLVYRGSVIPEFNGHYFFADWCGELVRSFRLTGQGQVADVFDWNDQLGELAQVTAFGTDADGELLAVNWAGELYRIVPVR